MKRRTAAVVVVPVVALAFFVFAPVSAISGDYAPHPLAHSSVGWHWSAFVSPSFYLLRCGALYGFVGKVEMNLTHTASNAWAKWSCLSPSYKMP